MLAVEQASRTALRGAVERVASAQRGGHVLVAARQIEDSVRGLVLDTRRAAWATGSSTFAKEVAVAKRAAVVTGAALSMPAYVGAPADDVATASDIARGYADAVTTTGPDIGTAIAANAWRLERIAATETSQAFNRSRLSNEERYWRDHRGADWLPLFVKVWDATLDKRVCATCKENNGSIRPIGFDWGGLLPGVVHANCRCTSMTLFLPIYRGQQDEAA